MGSGLIGVNGLIKEARNDFSLVSNGKELQHQMLILLGPVLLSSNFIRVSVNPQLLPWQCYSSAKRPSNIQILENILKTYLVT